VAELVLQVGASEKVRDLQVRVGRDELVTLTREESLGIRY
jgi:hypothetical protein